MRKEIWKKKIWKSLFSFFLSIMSAGGFQLFCYVHRLYRFFLKARGAEELQRQRVFVWF